MNIVEIKEEEEEYLTETLQQKYIDTTINNNNNMSKYEIFWYNLRDFINKYFCFKMLQNEKTVKWEEQLCNVSCTYSSQDYDRKSDQTKDDFKYIMNPMYKNKYIHGKPL